MQKHSPAWNRGTRRKELGETGSGFHLDPTSKAVNSQKAFATVGNNTGGSYHCTATGRQAQNRCDTGEGGWRQPARSGTGGYWQGWGWGGGSSWTLRSVTLIWILGVYDFDMREWEETPSSVHFSLPLTADVHPCYLDDVPHL